MKRFPFAGWRALAFLAALALPVGAWAELPDPLDAQAATPALHYQSPLKAYLGFSEQPLHNWREANDLVGRIGGWRTYAQEPYAQKPDTQAIPAQQSVEPPTKPMESHHGHH